MSDLIVIQPQVTQLEITEIDNTVTVASVGVQGPKGDTGATGAQGSSGVVAVTAPITNSGTSTSANIGIDQTGITIAESQVTNLVTDLAGKVPTSRTISTTAPLTGGGDLSANRTLAVSAGSTSAAGVLQLTDSTSSTSTTTAATPNAVKTVYDFASGIIFPFISGYYYRGQSAASITATAVATVNTTYYQPFFVSTATTFDRIQARAGSTFSGSSVVRLGIYGTASGKPSTLILDAGTISLTSAFQTGQITISQTLQPGLYWLAANSQTAATINTYYGPQASGQISFIGQPVLTDYTTVVYFTQASVTGAFANAGTIVNGTSTNGIMPMLRAQ